MDTTGFKEAVKQFFRDIYKVEYTSNFDVEYYYDGDIYRFTCKLKLNQDDKPITISAQFLTIDEFTTFTINELKNRRFPIVDYFYLVHSDDKTT